MFSAAVLVLILFLFLSVVPARAESPFVALFKRWLESVEAIGSRDLSAKYHPENDPAGQTPPEEESDDQSEAETVRVLDVTLEWEPSPDARVAGYLVYYGNASGKYLEPIDVGLETSCTVPGLDDRQNWYFSVKAYDDKGKTSDYSNEVARLSENVTPVKTAAQSGNATGDGPVVLDEEFGAQPPAPANGTGNPAGERSWIAAGLGSWPVSGGWIKALTEDFYHERWARLEWDRYNRLNGEARVARGDIDGDGRDELIVGMGSVAGDDTVPNGTFEVFDDDLTHLCWGQVNWQGYNERNGETWPACGDLDGDGRDEILIGTGRGGEGHIEVFSFSDGSLHHKSWMVSTWSEYNQVQGEVRPAVGDYDGDGKNDVIVGFGPVKESAELPGGAFEVLAADGSHLAWGEVSWGDYNELNGETRPVAGDLDGDGRCEIVIGLGAGANGAFEIQKLDDLGELVNQAWLAVPEWLEYNQANGETRPAVGNLDDDPAAEIAIALGPGGGGWVHLFDDRETGYRQYQSLRLWPDKYDAGNGASWLAIMENR